MKFGEQLARWNFKAATYDLPPNNVFTSPTSAPLLKTPLLGRNSRNQPLSTTASAGLQSSHFCRKIGKEGRFMELRPDDKVVIAKRFRRLRRKSLLTQKLLASLIGVCRQSVSEIENRRVLPHDRTWERFRNLETKHNEARSVHLPVHWR